MGKCGCCGGTGHTVSDCRSAIITDAIVLFTETPIDEMGLEDVAFFLRQFTTWKLTAMLNYLGKNCNQNGHYRSTKKVTKIAMLISVWKKIKAAEAESIVPRRNFKVYADALYTTLCHERGVINVVHTNWTFFRAFLSNAVYEMVNEIQNYDLVHLVNQHFVQNIPELRVVCLLTSRRYINRIFSSLQEEAILSSHRSNSKDHLNPLQIKVSALNNLDFKETKECVICVNPDNNTFVQLNCGHVMCQVCLLEIASQREKGFILCPFCREEISTLSMIGEKENGDNAAPDLGVMLATM